MIIKPTILRLLPLLTLAFFAFRSPEGDSNALIVKRIIWETVPRNYLDTGGREVRLDSAQACINRYIDTMANHGFAAQAGLPVNIQINTTSKITTGEIFDGKALTKWLDKVAAQYKAQHKKLMISIQLGIYDMNYLNTYQPGAATNATNNGRTALFIIPFDGNVSAKPNAMLAPAGSGGSGGGTGYDLGGVQP